MHVALLCPAWPLKRYPNGIVTYVDAMSRELRRQGHRVSVFASEGNSVEPDVYNVHASLRFQALRWWRRRTQTEYFPVFDWGVNTSSAILSVHRRQPIDVIEMEESFGWSADVSRITGIPIVVKLHGPAFMSLVEEELRSPAGIERVAREGVALREARVITSPAQRTLDETISRYSLAPVVSRHIVNPIELPPSAPLWALENCDRNTLLFVGRFDKRKGGDLMLHAFARLLADDPKLRLVFVGPDAGISSTNGGLVHFEAFCAGVLGANADRVEYRGRLSPNEIYALRAKAFLIVIASRWENQSYTALEAMLQGCPIVSCDAGGQAESVVNGVTGLVAKAGSVDEFCICIRTLLDRPDFAALLGQQARVFAVRNHAPKSVINAAVEVYERAIGLMSVAETRASPLVCPAKKT